MRKTPQWHPGTNFIVGFAGVSDVELIEPPFDFENLLGVDVNVGGLALGR